MNGPLKILKKKRKLNNTLDRRHPFDGVQGGGLWSNFHANKKRGVSVGVAFVAGKGGKL